MTFEGCLQEFLGGLGTKAKELSTNPAAPVRDSVALAVRIFDDMEESPHCLHVPSFSVHYSVFVQISAVHFILKGSGEKHLSSSPPVLIVEDNQTNQLIAQAMLNALGFNTLLASNGKEALSICRQNEVELATLQKLETKIGRSATHLVVDTFCRSLADFRNLLSEHVRNEDLQSLQRLGHRFRSAAESCGAVGFRNQCALLEKAESLTAIQRDSQNIRTLSATLERNLRLYLAQPEAIQNVLQQDANDLG